MNLYRNRTRGRFGVETLEGRIALSHMGAAVEDGPHHNRGDHAAQVQELKHGADDPAGHDAHEHQGAVEVVHHHRGRNGVDDRAGHK
jgi:hypothetical protein